MVKQKKQKTYVTMTSNMIYFEAAGSIMTDRKRTMQ